MAEFTTKERTLLAPFFTNLDQVIFGLKLPQEVAGALFSRYSRSTKSLRRTFLDEFLGDAALGIQEVLETYASGGPDPGQALQKAREFYDRVLVGYGDDSVAQLGGAHLACEHVSNVLAKILEDARIGMAPLEKSSRYVRFDQKDAHGSYFFYRDPRIMASPHAAAYLDTMTQLFDAYSRQLDPMIEWVAHQLPLTEVEFRHPKTGEPVRGSDLIGHATPEPWAQRAYRATLRAQACDLLRGYLPAATLTNVGLFGVGQAYEYLLTKLYSHDLVEAQSAATAMHKELRQLIPSFVKRAAPSEYLSATFTGMRVCATDLLADLPVETGSAVTLVEYDPEAEEKLVAFLLYPHARHPMQQLRGVVRRMGQEERQRVVDEALRRRRHRRDKPGRALENMWYTFDFLGNLGMYRDLQRHRLLTQERQDFTVEHGYEMPQELTEAGFGDEFARAMEAAAILFRKMKRDLPLEAQYVVPFAYRIRWYMTLNLREAFHIAELRTMPQGHPDYRTLVQEMARQIETVHPLVARYARFVDWGTYRLGRMTAEIRTEYRREKLTPSP